jgi:hypothetical protein
MQWPSPASVITMDAPEVITSAKQLQPHGCGAIVVYTTPDALPGKVLAHRREDGKLFEAEVRRHVIKGRPFVCAVFPGLGPGTYTVYDVTLERPATLTLGGRQIAQVDWQRPPSP